MEEADCYGLHEAVMPFVGDAEFSTSQLAIKFFQPETRLTITGTPGLLNDISSVESQEMSRTSADMPANRSYSCVSNSKTVSFGEFSLNCGGSAPDQWLFSGNSSPDQHYCNRSKSAEMTHSTRKGSQRMGNPGAETSALDNF